MKTIIQCDDVFEVLTAGPFPTGLDSDASVRDHLAACAACMQLAEALKPACNLLHESLSSNEKQTLPRYTEAEEQSLENNLRSVMQAIQPKESAMPKARTNPRPWPSQMVASLAVALLLILLASGARPWRANSAASVPNWQTLEAVPMSSHCFVDASAKKAVVDPPYSNRQYRCCTDCHNNTPQGNHAADALSLLASCGTCHN